MRYNVIVEPGYLKVEVSGREAGGDAKKLLSAVNKVMFKLGKKPIMICSTRGLSLSLTDLYVLVRHLSETPLRHLRTALLCDIEDVLESRRFIQAMGQQHGLDIAVCRTPQEAARWLAAGKAPG